VLPRQRHFEHAKKSRKGTSYRPSVEYLDQFCWSSSSSTGGRIFWTLTKTTKKVCFGIFVLLLVLLILELSVALMDDWLPNIISSPSLKQDEMEPAAGKFIPSSNEGNVQSKGPNSDIVTSRTKLSKLSDYLVNVNTDGDATKNDVEAPKTLEEARKGREEVLEILQDAGIQFNGASDIVRLPLWRQVKELYYNTNHSLDNSVSMDTQLPNPVILGLETCQNFRSKVPSTKDRYIAIAGNFNTGTTAFGLSLQANCKFPDHDLNRSNHVVHDVNGMLNQVPWAKHKMSYYRDNNMNVIHNGIDKEHVLPVIMVRDPYFWMQSMCKQGYGVRWDHDPLMHCPNLILNDFDRNRFKKKRNRQQRLQVETDPLTMNSTSESVPVWMGANPQVGPSWDSLIHYWNEWYESYLYQNVNDQNVTWPRLIVRFEDTLFHPKQVMARVCECGGGQLSSNFVYVVEEAKNHKHEQNNFVSAIVRYGADEGGHKRYRNMTQDDIDFARKSLNRKLMETFRYRY
jgi:hypothetical protein